MRFKPRSLRFYTTDGALVVTLVELLRLINCRFIIYNNIKTTILAYIHKAKWFYITEGRPNHARLKQNLEQKNFETSIVFSKQSDVVLIAGDTADVGV